MGNDRTLSHELADYVARMTFRDLPADVVAKARLCILDTVGCMLAGSANDVGQRITGYVARRGAPGECSVFGRRQKVSAEEAGLANGTLAHLLELDDGHRPSDNHLGCVVVPAALAMAQETGASGQDLLLAVVLGYDVMGRVGEAVCLPRLQTPFHGTGTTGVFGSAAVAGKLLGLPAARIAHAFGIAGTGAAGLREVFVSGADCKSLHVGRATQVGITAAYLAADGYQGPSEIFEGRYGFCVAMTPQPRPELICAELGQRFAVLESGFKVHAACGMLFTPVDATLWLRQTYRLDPLAVRRIKVGLPGWVRTDEVFTRRRPPTVGTARFSVPFGVAAALVEGEVTPRQIAPQKLEDPTIAAVEARVEVVADPEVDQIFEATKTDPFFFYPASVEIEDERGSYRRLERSPVGYDPARGLSQDQVVHKFYSLVEPVASSETAERLAEWALRLGCGSEPAELADLLGV